MLELSNALFGFWQEGGPSYIGWTESGEKVDEGYVVLFYQESDRRCYLRDVPNDILDTASSCVGRVGYICEYEKWDTAFSRERTNGRRYVRSNVARTDIWGAEYITEMDFGNQMYVTQEYIYMLGNCST